MTEIPFVAIESIDQVKQVADPTHLVLAFFQNPHDSSGPDCFVGIEPHCIQAFADTIKTFASRVDPIQQQK